MRPSIKRPEEATRAWTNLWVGWIALFFAIELSALARGRQADTLSWHVWVWFGVPRHVAPVRSVRVRRIALMSGMGWLAAHFLSGDEV